MSTDPVMSELLQLRAENHALRLLVASLIRRLDVIGQEALRAAAEAGISRRPGDENTRVGDLGELR